MTGVCRDCARPVGQVHSPFCPMPGLVGEMDVKPEPEPATTGAHIGQVYVSARGKSGRRWKVEKVISVKRAGGTTKARLVPLGNDVQPAQDSRGRMSGGVRAIRVAVEDLEDPKKWTRVDA